MSLYFLGIFFTIFFFNDTATTEIYTLSLHDALPIFHSPDTCSCFAGGAAISSKFFGTTEDRKSTRLNSSHSSISYAVFSLKKQNYAAGGARQSAEPAPLRYGSELARQP